MPELDLWAHVLEHWDAYVLPDLARFYQIPTWDEERLLERPWWWLRGVILSLFGNPDSLTGATFARLHHKPEEES